MHAVILHPAPRPIRWRAKGPAPVQLRVHEPRRSQQDTQSDRDERVDRFALSLQIAGVARVDEGGQRDERLRRVAQSGR